MINNGNIRKNEILLLTEKNCETEDHCTKILHTAGFIVDAAHTREDSLLKLSAAMTCEHSFNLVIADMDAPFTKDIFDMFNRINAQPHMANKIIFIGNPRAHNVEKITSATSVKMFLYKPVKALDLIAFVHTLI